MFCLNECFFIDEISSLNSKNIIALFNEMEKNSYEFSLVGMTMPCFLQDLIKKLLNDDGEYSVAYFGWRLIHLSS